MDPLRVYQHSNPGRLIFGPGALAELKKEISAKERPLLITDEGVARAGILKTVTDLLASIPSKVAAETGADALTHAIESYLAPGSQVTPRPWRFLRSG